jgi:hypothetical protein
MKLSKKIMFHLFILSVVIGAAYAYILITNPSPYIENFSSSCGTSCILLWIFVWVPLICVGIYILLFVILFGIVASSSGSQSVNQLRNY